MRIISFIFARKGSQGIRNKNLLKFKKTSLLGNSILQARKSRYISRTFVTTDSTKIAKEAKKSKDEVPFIRPAEISNDLAATNPVISHAVNWLESQGNLINHVCCFWLCLVRVLKKNF